MDTLCRKSFLPGLLFITLLITFLALGGCTVKFVADYDSTTFEEIIKNGKAVDRFYGDLLEKPENERAYRNYAEKYVVIETELRSLYLRNKARALNVESTRITEIVLTIWLKLKDNHATKDGYSSGTAKLDRTKFTRLFIAAADAEEAKKLTSQEKVVE